MAKSSAMASAAFVAAVAAAICGGLSFIAPSGQAQLQVPVQSEFSGESTHTNSPPGPASAPAAASLALVGVSAALALASRGALAASRRAAAAPARNRLVSVAAFESELGVQDPVGFWDPAGFTADGSTENFARRRQTELKHGRVSMLATMGYITPEITGKLPGYLSPSAGLKFADIPNGLGAISKVPAAGWAQIVAYGAFCELSQDQSAGTAAAAGDFGFKVLTSSDPSELGVQDPVGFWDPAGFTADGSTENFARRRQTELKHGRVSMLATMGYITPEITGKLPGYLSPSAGLKFADIPNGDAAEKQKKLAAEIANGRLAMMAIIGMFFQDGLTGSAWGDWALYTGSPLRAFESELGVQPPAGFWDPAGFTADGNAEDFARRRATEIKHGRISMLAAMGYITPQLIGPFPGYLSPQAGLKFADVPNGLGALSKVPLGGWGQIFLYCAYVEISQDQTIPGSPASRGEFGFKLLTSSDPAERQKKLAAEIANGRLAMMAIIGMFFQDGLTGSAWGDWALYTGSPLRAFENELGVQAPLGFWDPIGYTADGDQAAFKRRRATELKHGRISMLAAMGYITPELGFKFSGYLSPSMGLKFADIPNGLKAISVVPALGWAQIIAYMSFCEVSQDQKPGTKPGEGDFGFKVLTSSDPETLKKKLSAEIANGRLAMMAIIGMFFQDGLTGSPWGDWALYTDSPLRAFENELGVQAPLGFWDPIGYTADGDQAAFKRRRATELKHGRISMLAAMGYITPELGFKFSGYLSPSMGLKFADIPNGLKAISVVPALGWAQIIAYMSFCEVSQDQKPGTKPGEGDFGFKVLTSSDPETLKKKLSAEIANGRLAMMAIIGMFFQDGLTGSPWGDWALYTDSPLRAFENELGVQAPLGFWDPIGYTADGDQAAFKRRRATELKHGRISMLAAMGYITPELGFKFSGYLSPSMGLKFADIPNGLKAISVVPALGWAQIIAYMSFCEVSQDQKPGTKPGEGDFGFKVLTSSDPETLKKKLSAEIANGRLAMMAIIGMFFQDGLTGSPWGDWALYTDSPLRAFENELGVQAPLGFWDPIGYTADGDQSETGVQPPVGFWDPLGLSSDGSAFNFARRREVELKHGRVSMFATIGYIVPEYYKLPGFLSPSYGIEFSEVPNGLGALSKVPALGWLQIILLAGVTEVQIYKDRVNGEPGNYGAGFLGCKSIGLTSNGFTDPEYRKMKLNAELANGRLAMMAIIGMFFQDGLTGSAWGDWALYTDSPLR
ncbi:unnamed protein product [Prorocentrum cordatum]|uniref:Uncharacterized protein n=1 Tax=Prorocentrum cordatum TaxID=2364126 RepID=A0ABN9R0F1_9DINO|nr:unnamed protein product [Polarella glacialis]